MNPRVKKVTPEANGQLLLEFLNGEQRIFSVLPYLHYPVYKPLCENHFFQTASVFNGTVCWGAGGEIDFDPDILFLESVTAGATYKP